MTRPLFRAVLLLGGVTLLNSDRVYAQNGKTPLTADRLTFRVRIYNDEGVPEGDLSVAMKIADTVLQRVGLQAMWHDCTVGNPNRDSSGCDTHPAQIDLVLYLVARLEAHAPDVDRRALGYSLVPRNGERGTMAYVSYARVRTVLCAFRGEQLLGLAVAHEIGHLLLGTNTHSNSGLMRAPWLSKDLDSGDWEQFTFTSEQAKRLREAVLGTRTSLMEEMIALARELGVRMIACEMSRDVMGIKESELVAGLECGGVASFLADSLKSRTSLFI